MASTPALFPPLTTPRQAGGVTFHTSRAMFMIGRAITTPPRGFHRVTDAPAVWGRTERKEWS